jgi:hypothetical protein
MCAPMKKAALLFQVGIGVACIIAPFLTGLSTVGRTIGIVLGAFLIAIAGMTLLHASSAQIE